MFLAEVNPMAQLLQTYLSTVDFEVDAITDRRITVAGAVVQRKEEGEVEVEVG
jgi:hypothetical protein